MKNELLKKIGIGAVVLASAGLLTFGCNNSDIKYYVFEAQDSKGDSKQFIVPESDYKDKGIIQGKIYYIPNWK
jgi:hypothetical protein